MPDPAPSTVFESRYPVSVVARDGRSITVDERGVLSAVPTGFSGGGTTAAISAWAGPWPVDERWWADSRRGASNQAVSNLAVSELPVRRGPIHRFQIIDGAGVAWLLVLDRDSWWAEARYD
jgi:protein ImuB